MSKIIVCVCVCVVVCVWLWLFHHHCSNTSPQGMEEYDVRLDLRIQDIHVIKDEVIVPPDADGKTALNDAAYWAFFDWLIRNGYEYDHALLLTGLNLISSYRSNDTEGYAYMNTMCSPGSVSLVENVVNGIPAVVIN